ncbi:DJ-1/PfpI family protein [Haloquadratum walsbyi]|jgi:Transcriptional regulator containing an amidase domain and an AraC-type DNA-binding HTH domain|uniref:Putative transcriptional regulator n=1 Tax=Haloquadratum walsbyi J07HQW2 TaxID=1238425 RepID=U1NBX7_9EURY|nr:DJ-1/PfpI family protein [Haloquadratum walsbyi]ERG94385.1 MAG: putative transcriptional regulator [Haloquadratum walsbyi J07HQW2]
MEIVIILFDGVDELDAVGPFEVFENAANAGADLDVTLCTLNDSERVTASHSLEIGPTVPLGDRVPDLLVVPGGQWSVRGGTGAWTEAKRGDLPDAIARLHDDGSTIAGVCTGGMLMQRAGVLDGRPAITHHGAVEDLQKAGTEVVDARVVDDGDVITAGGVTSGIDLALHVIQREFGSEIANTVSKQMEYKRRGRVQHNS